MRKNLLYLFKSPKTIFGLFLFLLLCCSGKTENEAKELVEKSIKAHGGQKTYENLKAISFLKTSRLFLEDGSLESEVVQNQSFQLKPDYRVQIEWVRNGNNHVIFYDGKKAIKTIDGQVLKDSLEVVKAENAAKAAAYVFFQPFELLNENTVLTMEANTELNDSTTARAIRVKYSGDNDNSDKWTYYFNNDNLLIANSVILIDHNSLIMNLEFQKAAGLIFNKHRKSYRVDKQLNKKYLRAEYFYEEISVTK